MNNVIGEPPGELCIIFGTQKNQIRIMHVWTKGRSPLFRISSSFRYAMVVLLGFCLGF